jgi:O-antigen ligase
LVSVAFALFVASIPFEGISMGMGSVSVSRFAGWIFFALALLQPGVCFRRPPAAFWFFAAYVVGFVALGFLEPSVRLVEVRSRVVLLVQMLVVLWTSSNLLRYQPVFLGTLYTFVASCVALSILQLLGVTSEVAAGRESALEQDPNTLGAVLSLGLVAAVGIAYGGGKGGRLARVAVWFFFGLIGIGVVRTGSRGAFIALAAGIGVLVLRRGSASQRFRNLLIVATGLAVLIAMAVSSDVARKRWGTTLERGSMAGREKIFPTAWAMFLERPIFGWGLEVNRFELAARLGEADQRDTHNLYLMLLTEDGLLGGLPYFVGLSLCVSAAWKARRLTYGLVPIALVSALLLVNMSLTWQYRKQHWFLLGLALASARPVALATSRRRSLVVGSSAGIGRQDAMPSRGALANRPA